MDSGRGKWALLLPLVLLCCLILLIKINDDTTHKIMLYEKYVSIQDTVDSFAEAGNATSARTPEEFERHILREAVESLDRRPYVYGALFGLTSNGKLARLSERYAENYAHASFDVPNYPEFIEMAMEQESGYITLKVTDSPLGEHDALVYYRWTPMKFEPQDRLLIVGGVTRYSVRTSIPAVINLSLWAAAFATAIMAFYVIGAEILRRMHDDRKAG